MPMYAHPLSLFAIDRKDKSSLGCSDGIVNLGDTEAEVIEKCGEPVRRTVLREGKWHASKRVVMAIRQKEGLILDANYLFL